MPETPGDPQTVSAPQALGQTFTLSSERIVSAVHPVVGDAMLGNATVARRGTVVSFGVRVPGDALATIAVPLPAAPTSVDAVLPTPLRLAAGTYAIVVDPPGAESTVGVGALRRRERRRCRGAHVHGLGAADRPAAGPRES